MSAPENKEGGGKAAAAPAKDPYVEFAEKIYINLVSRVYSSPAGADGKRPEPKMLAAFCFRLVDAFEQASNETPRRLAEIEAKNKASVKLDQVDISAMFAPTAKPAAQPAAAPAAAPAKPK
jgi:hypothetical protein